MKYIRIYYEGRNNTEEVKQRHRIPLSCLCLKEKLYFCENAQTTLTCSVVTLTCLVAISSHLSEVNPQQFGIIAHPTSDQLKACSCARSGTSGSSLAFPTLTVARAMLLQATVRRDNCSFLSNSTQHVTFSSASFELLLS